MHTLRGFVNTLRCSHTRLNLFKARCALGTSKRSSSGSRFMSTTPSPDPGLNTSSQKLSLKDSLSYCRETVRARSPDVFEHIHLLPARQQTQELALRAFALELYSIPFSASNPTLAMMRLQWWRSAIERVQAIVEDYHGVKSASSDQAADGVLPHPPNHYVVQVLAHLARDDYAAFDFDLLHSMLAAHESYVDRQQPDTLPDLVSLVDRDYGAMMTLLVGLTRPVEHKRGVAQLGRIPEEARKAAVLTARGSGLAQVLRAAPYWLRQRHTQMPKDILAEHELNLGLLKKYAIQLDSGIMSATQTEARIEYSAPSVTANQPAMGVPEEAWSKMPDSAKVARMQGESLRAFVASQAESRGNAHAHSHGDGTVCDHDHGHSQSAHHGHTHAHSHGDGVVCNHDHGQGLDHEVMSTSAGHTHSENGFDKESRAVAANLREVAKVIAAISEEQLEMGLDAAAQARSSKVLSKSAACEVVLPTIATTQFLTKLKEVDFDIFHPRLASMDSKEMFELRAKTLWKYIRL